MNRLILIGNGFDLAHGMKTCYYDFILWYLKKAFINSHEKIFDDELTEVIKLSSVQNSSDISDINSVNDIELFLKFLRTPTEPHPTVSLPSRVHTNTYSLFFKTSFIRNLMVSCSHCKWVDIEQQYYLEVLKILGANHTDTQKHSIIKKINDDLEFLKAQLQQYIKTQNANKNIQFYHSPYMDEITEGIDYRNENNLSNKEIQNIDSMINEGKIKKLDENRIAPQATMFLNFNYTNTIENYLNNSFVTNKLGYTPLVNYIHGDVNSDIVFGFGDEVDDQYINIEKQNDNEFLRHIKSFHYFKNGNYKELLRYIESDIYEVYIWGHSCGLSDRTLLNMIFENEKCKSIKIFHYNKSTTFNNYTELTQEISRHFRKKQLMRKLIVPFNKSNYMHQY